MPRARLIVVCALTLCAFASNSLLTRGALGSGQAGAASFAALRLLSGAAMMWILSRNRQRAGVEAGWRSALWLFLYAAPFSWAYLRLSAGVGAFLLFGTVQATMIGAAVVHGERPPPRTWAEDARSEEHTSELQSRGHLVCRLLLEKKKMRLMVQSCQWVGSPTTLKEQSGVWGVAGVTLGATTSLACLGVGWTPGVVGGSICMRGVV